VQCSPLLALPAEIQKLIWDNLTNPADQSMLALTCKAQASFYMNLGPAKEPRSSPEQRINFLLRLQDFSAHQKYRLCFKCRKFKPLASGWGGMTKYLKSAIVNREAAIKGPNCMSINFISRLC
jgi:hypothetical protein